MWVADAQAQQAFDRQWGGGYTTQDWNRFYHYPYVYYPQNFWGTTTTAARENLYYRYPPEMQIPVYNRGWHNEYPQPRRYYQGHDFILDDVLRVFRCQASRVHWSSQVDLGP